MNMIQESIEASMKFGNEMYAAGYKEGVAQGRREAFLEAKKLLDDTFPQKQPEAV